jgi:hypothetical protein
MEWNLILIFTHLKKKPKKKRQKKEKKTQYLVQSEMELNFHPGKKKTQYLVQMNGT